MEYDLNSVLDALRELADDRLAGEVAVEFTVWDDGDFMATAFHTIDATYPFDAVERGEGDGLPFYRERLRLTTDTPRGHPCVLHEVVRRWCGRTGCYVMWSHLLT